MTEHISGQTAADQTRFDLSPLVPANYLIESPEHRGLPLSDEDAAHYKDVLGKVKNPVVTLMDSHRTIGNPQPETVLQDESFNYFSVMRAAIRSARGIAIGVNLQDGQLVTFDPWALQDQGRIDSTSPIIRVPSLRPQNERAFEPLMDPGYSGRSRALRMVMMALYVAMSESATPDERQVPESYDSSLARIDAVLAETSIVDPEISFRNGDTRYSSDFTATDPNETFRL